MCIFYIYFKNEAIFILYNLHKISVEFLSKTKTIIEEKYYILMWLILKIFLKTFFNCTH